MHSANESVGEYYVAFGGAHNPEASAMGGTGGIELCEDFCTVPLEFSGEGLGEGT